MAYTAFDTLGLRALIGTMSHKTLRVYVLLATYADRTGICWPGIAELASRSGLRVESVIDAMEDLEAAGLMVYVRRNERDAVTKKQLPNVYEIRGCLVKADSAFVPGADSAFKHETQTTNVVTNDNNQFHSNHLHAPPPLTNKPRRETEKQRTEASTMRSEGETGEGQKQPRRNSRAATAPQNSKAPLPLPPLPRGFDANAAMVDQDDEVAARWLCDQATTRLDGGEYRAAMTLANARRYVVRFGRWKIRAAITIARSDPTTKTLVGRMHYLLCTSVAEEAQRLEDAMQLINDNESTQNSDTGSV